jgi:hypothetical protein
VIGAIEPLKDRCRLAHAALCLRKVAALKRQRAEIVQDVGDRHVILAQELTADGKRFVEDLMLFQQSMRCATAATLGDLGTSVVDQDLTNRRGRNGKVWLRSRGTSAVLEANLRQAS